MKAAFISALLLVAFVSCKKENHSLPAAHSPALPGGKGGPFNIAVFSKINGRGAPARIYLKYGADKMPADTALYEEKGNTMTEPGVGHHVHFSALTTGIYFIYLKGDTVQADTVLRLTDSSEHVQDLYLNMY